MAGPIGVGRHSLSRITSTAADCHLFQQDWAANWSYSEWIESFKVAIVRAANEEKRCVYIVSDAEYKHDQCKAIINHVLAKGDVMYLFTAEEKADLVEQMRLIDAQKEKSLQVTDFEVGFLICRVS